jgi:Spy/CpxP family protein refolding chaperone
MKLSQLSFLAALALGALVAIVPNARAQDTKDAAKPALPASGARSGRGGGAAQLDRLSERLKLTDDQKTKLQPILKEEAAKLRELRDDKTVTEEQRPAKAREIRQQYLAKIKPILTTEQFDQLKKMREQNRGQRGGGGQRPAGEPRPSSGDDKKE